MIDIILLVVTYLLVIALLSFSILTILPKLRKVT